MTHPAGEALAAAGSDQRPPFTHLVDAFVLAVTESLCLLEKDHPRAMQASHLQSRKTAILDCLETLDDMVARYRATAGH